MGRCSDVSHGGLATRQRLFDDQASSTSSPGQVSGMGSLHPWPATPTYHTLVSGWETSYSAASRSAWFMVKITQEAESCSYFLPIRIANAIQMTVPEDPSTAAPRTLPQTLQCVKLRHFWRRAQRGRSFQLPPVNRTIHQASFHNEPKEKIGS